MLATHRATEQAHENQSEAVSYIIYALAILPDHAHLVLGAHEQHIDDIARHLKAKATMQLSRESLHPFANDPSADGTFPSPWARNYWSPFIDSSEYLHKAINVCKRNPLRSGLKRQHWSIVQARP